MITVCRNGKRIAFITLSNENLQIAQRAFNASVVRKVHNGVVMECNWQITNSNAHVVARCADRVVCGNTIMCNSAKLAG